MLDRTGLVLIVSRLISDRGGATAIALALVVMTMVLAAGGAVDYYAMFQWRTSLQGVADSAVIAGAITADEGSGDAAVQTTVRTYVTRGFDDPHKTSSTVATTIDTTLGQVATQVSVDIPTTFLKMIGIAALPVSVKSAASYGGGQMEVALAIDVTGSMDGPKLTAAKSAAKSLIQTLFTVPGTTKVNTKVKVGVVPFARYVNVGTAARGQSWLSVPADATTTTNQCWVEDQGGYCSATQTVTSTCYNDGVPYACSWEQCTNWVSGKLVTVCGPVTTTTAWHGCVGSRKYPNDLQAEANVTGPVPGVMDEVCNAQLVRLTQDQTALAAAIDGLAAWDETYIAPGMLWAWRVLSPRQPFADGSSNTQTTKKAIILMTDGFNTVSATYPTHWGGDTADSNAVLSKICANAKAEGIAVYTIAFQVSDSTVKSILTGCATNASYFFDSGNIAQMQAAFKQIGSQLSSRRLVY